MTFVRNCIPDNRMCGYLCALLSCRTYFAMLLIFVHFCLFHLSFSHMFSTAVFVVLSCIQRCILSLDYSLFISVNFARLLARRRVTPTSSAVVRPPYRHLLLTHWRLRELCIHPHNSSHCVRRGRPSLYRSATRYVAWACGPPADSWADGRCGDVVNEPAAVNVVNILWFFRPHLLSSQLIRSCPSAALRQHYVCRQQGR
jgi:hypothetical protein